MAIKSGFRFCLPIWGAVKIHSVYEQHNTHKAVTWYFDDELIP